MSSTRPRSSTSTSTPTSTHRYIINLHPDSNFWTNNTEMAKKPKGKQALAAAHQHGAPDNLAAATAPPHNPFVGQALLDSLDQTDAPLATSSPSVQTPNVAADPKTAVATGAHSKLTRKQKRKLKKEQQQHPASKSKSSINKDDNPTRMSKAQRKKRKRGRKRQLDAVLEALAVAESAATMSKSYLAVPNPDGTDERDALANLHGTYKRHMYAPKHTVKINTALAHQMPFPQAAPTTASIAAPTATGIAAPTTASVTPNEQPPSGALAAQHPLAPSWQNAYPPGLRSMQNMPPSYWQSYANAAPNPYAPYPWLMPPVPPQGHEHTGQTGGVPLPAPPVPLPGNSRPPTQQPPWRNREAHGLLRPQMDSSAKQHHPMSLRPRIPRRSRSPRKERSEKIEIEGHGPDWAVRVPPVPVPVPTAKYLAQAKREPTRLSRPQHLLIVTDLNGTLICRSKTSKGFQPRPDLGYFLKHVFTDHAVMVWSSARPETVARTCEKIFTPADRSALCAEWSRDQLDLTPEQYAEKVQVYKRLSYIWETAEQEEWHPQHAQGGRYGAHNTLLLDDSVLKASSEPHNLVEVPEFEGGPMEKQARTGVLRQVMTYLDEVARWDNAAAFVKRNPFKLNTSSVGSWDRWEPSHGAP